MIHRDPLSISGAVDSACLTIGGGSRKVGAEKISLACEPKVSEHAVRQWIHTGCVPFHHIITMERLCIECSGVAPFAAALRAGAGKQAVKVSVRNMSLRVMDLAGRIAKAGLKYSLTGCARAREDLVRAIGKMVLKLHKFQAGIAR